MRPSAQGFLRYPLNEVLRSEGAVRVLRTLSRHGGALAPQTIARQAGLSNPGVNRLLQALTETGLVLTVGEGRYPVYQVDMAHPLATPLEVLFAAEDDRWQAVLDAVRAAARPYAPLAIWWYGSSARNEDTPGSDLDVAVLLPDAAPESAATAVREALQPTETALHVAISLVTLSPGDVRRLAAGDPWWVGLARDAIPLQGPPPEMMARTLAVGALGHPTGSAAAGRPAPAAGVLTGPASGAGR